MSASGGVRGTEGAELPSRDEVLEADLVNLSKVSLAELRLFDGSPIAKIVARMINDAEDSEEAIAGFESAV